MALLEQLRMKLNNKEYMKTRGSIYRYVWIVQILTNRE